MSAIATFTERTLGRTGRKVFPLGLASSYGIDAPGVEEAIERGVNYVYWGSLRRRPFGDGLRNAARRNRERLVVVVQSYSRIGMLIRGSLCRAMSRLGLEYVDVLLLGWWNAAPPPRILDAALSLKRAGLVRHIGLSTHERPVIPKLASGEIDVFHVRYNAAHRGAESEVFPALSQHPQVRPGIVAFTATRWGTLLGPSGSERPAAAADCYRFVLSHSGIDVVLSGPRDRHELLHALSAVNRGPMDEAELAWIRAHGDRVRAAHKRAIVSGD